MSHKLNQLLLKTRQVIDGITMYRVLLYGLLALVALALMLSALDIVAYASFEVLLGVLGLCLLMTGLSNLVLPRLYGVTPNHESSIITALILFFVIGAPSGTAGWVGIALAAVFAMASKYVITWRSAHIFNPAAFGVLVVSVLGIGNGAWWIADAALFWPMLLVGFVVLYKLRRFELFWAFFLPAFAIIIVRLLPGSTFIDASTTALTLYPLLFLGAIMLTEPSTMPTGRYERAVFGVLVGVLFALTFDLGFIAASPHLALLIGNIFAFVVTRRSSSKLKLAEVKQLTPTTYSYSFEPDKSIPYAAGQYMEFTVPGVKFGARGNRRSFSIASAPGDKRINIGVKHYSSSSKFKEALKDLKLGDEIIANHVAGEFVLPTQTTKSLVFVAGGIGITPFISMIRHMLAHEVARPIELYYFVSDKTEIAYKDVLKSASKVGVKVHIRVGRDEVLTNEDIATHSQAEYFLSGPPGLVRNYKLQLRNAGIKRVHVDYFTGY